MKPYVIYVSTKYRNKHYIALIYIVILVYIGKTEYGKESEILEISIINTGHELNLDVEITKIKDKHVPLKVSVLNVKHKRSKDPMIIFDVECRIPRKIMSKKEKRNVVMKLNNGALDIQYHKQKSKNIETEMGGGQIPQIYSEFVNVKELIYCLND